jgi:hypothetical protein
MTGLIRTVEPARSCLGCSDAGGAECSGVTASIADLAGRMAHPFDK